MKKYLSLFVLTLFLTAAAGTLSACAGGGGGTDIQTAYSNLKDARQNSLAEFGITIPIGEGLNVYDTADVNVTACIRDAAGNGYDVPMFYYEEYESRLVGTREEMYKTGEGQFRFRFTPRTAGEYNFYINIVERGGVKSRYPKEGTLSFVAAAGTRDGFLTVAEDGTRLVFDNGRPFIGIGNNFCGWEWAGDDNGGGTYDYGRWFHSLAENGANMTQFDLCEGDQIEWTAKEGELEWSDCYGGLGVYNQKAAAKTDEKVELADALGLFYRFTLFHWEDFDTETDSFPDWGWSRNPYNVRNGGPVSDVGDFFRDETARRAVKNYLRYSVARWGYSPSLMFYELFNEVDAPDMAWGTSKSYASCLSDLRSWHEEMAAYLKETDVNAHMVTTSCANYAAGGEFWDIDDMDVTTFHRYTMYNAGGNEMPYETVKSLKSLVSGRISSTRKPTVAGEFAISPAGSTQREFDKDGVAFHNALYASVLAGSFGTAMSWNWGSYVDEYNLYPHYRGAALLLGEADLTGASAFDNLSEPAAAGKVWYMGQKQTDRAYLWIKDSLYDYPQTLEGYAGDEMAEGTVRIEGMKAGSYIAQWIDTYRGAMLSETSAVADANGVLTLPYPAFRKDIAVKLVHADVYFESYNMYSGNDDGGFVPLSSYTRQDADSVTLYANGYDIGGTSDAGRFAYRRIRGDFTFTARLDRANYSANGAKAGIMVRDGLASAARMAFLGCSNGGEFAALYRKTAGTPAGYDRYGMAQMGTYLRIERHGNVLVAYLSEDGAAYKKVSEQEFAGLADELLVGVMAANKNTLGYNKAVFHDISFGQ